MYRKIILALLAVLIITGTATAQPIGRGLSVAMEKTEHEVESEIEKQALEISDNKTLRQKVTEKQEEMKNIKQQRKELIQKMKDEELEPTEFAIKMAKLNSRQNEISEVMKEANEETEERGMNTKVKVPGRSEEKIAPGLEIARKVSNGKVGLEEAEKRLGTPEDVPRGPPEFAGEEEENEKEQEEDVPRGPPEFAGEEEENEKEQEEDEKEEAKQKDKEEESEKELEEAEEEQEEDKQEESEDNNPNNTNPNR